jgi:hypothetical protein
MPYRVPAVNEAAIQDENELVSMRRAFGRQRARARVGVAIVATVILVVLVVALGSLGDDSRVTYSLGEATTTSCSEDTCLCWSDHEWTYVACPPPNGPCFRSAGTCP